MTHRDPFSSASPGAGTPPVDCATALQQLWDFLDAELTPERFEAIRHHLQICSRCFPHYDFEKTFLEAIAATRPECCAPAHLRERIESALKQAGFGGKCNFDDRG